MARSAYAQWRNERLGRTPARTVASIHVTSIAPATGGGGTVLTILGSGLTHVTDVLLVHGTSAIAMTFFIVSDSHITAVVPGSVGAHTYDVHVIAKCIDSVVKPGAFTANGMIEPLLTEDGQPILTETNTPLFPE
jgi:hypothetical protein